MKGSIKFFTEKGWGFIVGEDGQDYFVHHSALEDQNSKDLAEGQEVEFEVGQTSKGLCATEVRRI